MSADWAFVKEDEVLAMADNYRFAPQFAEGVRPELVDITKKQPTSRAIMSLKCSTARTRGEGPEITRGD